MHLLRVDHSPALLGSLGYHVQAAATELRELVANPIGDTHRVEAIHELHGKTDRFTQNLAQRLERNLVTEIDREEVATLAFHVGNVIALIDGTARRVRTFAIQEPHAHAGGLCEVLVRATTQIASAMDNLDWPRRVLLDLACVRELEDVGDRLYGAAVSTLFGPNQTELDVLEIMKWKELFDRLADAIHECHRAGRVLRRVALART